MLEVKFSPNAGIEAFIVQHINAATATISGLLNMYQSGPIHTAILAKRAAGKTVKLIFDRRQQFLANPRIMELIAAGASCYWDKHEKQIHSQYLIIDNGIVLVGSYLYCYTSEIRYADVILHIDQPYFALNFTTNFNAHLAHSELIT